MSRFNPVIGSRPSDSSGLLQALNNNRAGTDASLDRIQQSGAQGIQAAGQDQQHLAQMASIAAQLAADKQDFALGEAQLAQQGRELAERVKLEKQQLALTETLSNADRDASTSRALLASEDSALNRQSASENAQLDREARSELQATAIESSGEEADLDRGLRKEALEQELVLAKQGDIQAQSRLDQQLEADRIKSAEAFSNDTDLVRMRHELDLDMYNEKIRNAPVSPEVGQMLSTAVTELDKFEPEQLSTMLGVVSNDAERNEVQRLIDLKAIQEIESMGNVALSSEYVNSSLDKLMPLVSDDLRADIESVNGIEVSPNYIEKSANLLTSILTGGENLGFFDGENKVSINREEMDAFLIRQRERLIR